MIETCRNFFFCIKQLHSLIEGFINETIIIAYVLIPRNVKRNAKIVFWFEKNYICLIKLQKIRFKMRSTHLLFPRKKNK